MIVMLFMVEWTCRVLFTLVRKCKVSQSQNLATTTPSQTAGY